MKLTDWYINTKFGSRLTSPELYARSRPIYDALTPAEQLEWRRTKAAEAFLMPPMVVVSLVVFTLMGVGIGTSNESDKNGLGVIPVGFLFAALGILFLITGAFALMNEIGYRQRKRRFPALNRPRIPRPAHVSRLTWAIARSLPVSQIAYVTKKQRSSGYPYALAFDRATDEQRIALRLSIARRFAVGPALCLVAMLPVGFVLGHMPYKLTFFVPLSTFLCCFAIGLAYTNIWTHRVWPKRILGETRQAGQAA